MVSKDSCHLCGISNKPDSPHEALWQQHKFGLQHCANALLRRQAKVQAQWMSEQTWAWVHSKQDTYKAMKHALPVHEIAACQRQHMQALNECKNSVRADRRAEDKGCGT